MGCAEAPHRRGLKVDKLVDRLIKNKRSLCSLSDLKNLVACEKLAPVQIFRLHY